MKISFRGEVYPGYAFNRVKVLHGKANQFRVSAWSNDTTIQMETSEMESYTEIQFDRYMDTLHLRFDQTDSTQRQFTLQGIILESDDPGIFYHASGVNGASTTSWLRCPRFTKELALAEARPRGRFSIGINDAHDPDFSADRYERNYEELIASGGARRMPRSCSPPTRTATWPGNIRTRTGGSAGRDASAPRATGCGVWDTLA
ncbi:MAG: hypothetical protein IPO87_15075 [Flavobacteriales bacterium]|nr:hypothetical protein [Flavobacteriales bacterium]